MCEERKVDGALKWEVEMLKGVVWPNSALPRHGLSGGVLPRAELGSRDVTAQQVSRAHYYAV